mgnify:FL=1|tara:strand:+ start:1152 stop:1277 length:126 start_codon:yes stop_codon:yes gene_type:complete
MTKIYFSFFLIIFLSGCGTIGGAISGVGEDIKDVGDFIKSE